jgi:hypothetical protein
MIHHLVGIEERPVTVVVSNAVFEWRFAADVFIDGDVEFVRETFKRRMDDGSLSPEQVDVLLAFARIVIEALE